MTRSKIQVCLVSDQPIPNLLPIADPESRPDQVILLVSQEKIRQAEWLKSQMQHYPDCLVTIKPCAAFDYRPMEETVFDVLVEHADDDVTLNATGGTKLMVLAAFGAFRTMGLPAFYVDTTHNEVIYLLPSTPGKPMEVERRSLANRMKITAYLESYGYQITRKNRKSVPREWVELGQWLVQNVPKLSEPLHELNRLADQAKKNKSLLSSITTLWSNESFRALVERFERVGILREERQALRFENEEKRFFANGGWFEHYVFGVVDRLRGRLGITDLMENVTVVSPDGVPNEFDVVFTANNRLYIIECKTKAFERDGSELQSHSLYKLEALIEKVGGLFGTTMLVSYHSFDRHVEKRFGESKKVQLVRYTELRNLESRLYQWVNSRKSS